MLWPNGLPVEPRLSGVESEADFGPRKIGKGFHDGVDYGAALEWAHLYAARQPCLG
jgi:hypothetical protein